MANDEEKGDWKSAAWFLLYCSNSCLPPFRRPETLAMTTAVVTTARSEHTATVPFPCKLRQAMVKNLPCQHKRVIQYRIFSGSYARVSVMPHVPLARTKRGDWCGQGGKRFSLSQMSCDFFGQEMMHNVSTRIFP